MTKRYDFDKFVNDAKTPPRFLDPNDPKQPGDSISYKGYGIKLLRDGSYVVEKDGYRIIGAATIAVAKKEIDTLV